MKQLTEPGAIMANNGSLDPGSLITGRSAKRLRRVFRLRILFLALRVYRNPFVAMRVLRQLIALKRSLVGDLTNMKWLKSGGRYFWNISSPGWPSLAFERFLLLEMDRIKPLKDRQNLLQTLIFSITSRCPLSCEHCYEWSNLADREYLSLAQLQQILRQVQDLGVSSIELSGGEPLSRFDDLISLLESARAGTDFWILTSGFGLDAGKAKILKKAGLTGAVISLDHFDEAIHNRFRGNPQSYAWVWKAVQNAQQAGLAVALSLCVTRDFLSRENLDKYLKLATDNGVQLIRMLEPRSVGHYQGQDIELSEEQFRLLDEYFLRTKSDPAYSKSPILDYLAYYQRRLGCFGGDRYAYIDSRGELHACPFCQQSAGNALVDDLQLSLATLKHRGCHKYPKADPNRRSLSERQTAQ